MRWLNGVYSEVFIQVGRWSPEPTSSQRGFSCVTLLYELAVARTGVIRGKIDGVDSEVFIQVRR